MNCCVPCALRHEIARLGRSALLRAGGYGIYPDLMASAFASAMLEEAMRGPWRWDKLIGPDTEEIRGGAPARDVICVGGGPIQDQLFKTPALDAFVAGEVGLPVRRLGARASYSIYAGPTSHLDIHRDIVGCDLSLVTCLYDDAPHASGGAFDLWLDDLTTPLGEIRSNPDRRRSRMVMRPGDTLLIHGGLVPHRIPQAGSDRLRVVSLVCYEIPPTT